MVTSPHVVRMYSRSFCHLCDDARAVVMDAAARAVFEFQEVLIDGDDELEGRYGLRVPVVLVDGVEAFEYTVDQARLRRLVAAPTGR